MLNIPSTLRAGDTISWTDSISDYPAISGWSLAYALRCFAKPPINITASTSGSDFLISVLPSDSKGWLPGTYSWFAYVYKGTSPTFTDRKDVGGGQIEILPDLFQVGTQTDLRSHVKKMLDEVQAVLEVKASGGDISGYSIGGRSASKYSYTELRQMYDLYKTEYQREVDKENQGKSPDINPRHIGIRFRDAS